LPTQHVLISFDDIIESYTQGLQLLATISSTETLCGADLRVKQSTCYLRASKIQDAFHALKKAHGCDLRQLGEDHPATLGAAANLRSVQTMSEKITKGRITKE
jgi:hypothetical protein